MVKKKMIETRNQIGYIDNSSNCQFQRQFIAKIEENDRLKVKTVKMMLFEEQDIRTTSHLLNDFFFKCHNDDPNPVPPQCVFECMVDMQGLQTYQQDKSGSLVVSKILNYFENLNFVEAYPMFMNDQFTLAQVGSKRPPPENDDDV